MLMLPTRLLQKLGPVNVLFSLQLTWGFRTIILEGDSLSIIKKLNTVKDDRSILRPISLNIRRLADFMDGVSYQFVPRSGNRAAHTLALEGRRRNSPCFWVEEAPISVEVLAASDWLDWSRRG
ncbi:hypothetical protein PVK06_042791 [Gossypium arboreum]|uniref:RNase H type-1 domain-containing protein n=1 Tax=Gossypium arboreum TaxID=29729 RepID=A0ABR0MLQ5_GOSAR|nr:hypothetical protein PVK06_042791 [Gossypium arboreum]